MSQKTKKSTTKKQTSTKESIVFEKQTKIYKFFDSRRLLAGTRRGRDGANIPQYASSRIYADQHALNIRRLINDFDSGNCELRIIAERSGNIGGLTGFLSRLTRSGLHLESDDYQFEMIRKLNEDEEPYYIPELTIRCPSVDAMKSVLSEFLN